jgi:hypothetical protein
MLPLLHVPFDTCAPRPRAVMRVETALKIAKTVRDLKPGPMELSQVTPSANLLRLEQKAQL